MSTATEAGWSMTPEGLIWGDDARARLMTMLRMMAGVMTPDDQHEFAQPEPPASHEHVATNTASPCTCQAIWLSGDMPPRDELPRRPGVYLCFDQDCRVAYIGTSRSNVRARLVAHHRDPAKPALAAWLGFWPSEFSDPAAAWEIRLIDRLGPYLNRQHAERAQPVQWEPKPPAPPVRPWYESDPHYQWFMDGPGLVLPLAGSQPWQIAKVIRALFQEGATEAEVWEACDITLTNKPGAAVPYLASVVRQRRAQQEQA